MIYFSKDEYTYKNERKVILEKFYSTIDIARACGVSKSTIYQWIIRGKLSDVKIRNNRGDRIWTQSDLDRFVAYAKSRPKAKGGGESVE